MGSGVNVRFYLHTETLLCYPTFCDCPRGGGGGVGLGMLSFGSIRTPIQKKLFYVTLHNATRAVLGAHVFLVRQRSSTVRFAFPVLYNSSPVYGVFKSKNNIVM